MIQVAVHAQVHAIRHAALRVLQVVMVVLHRPAAHLAVLLVVVLALEHVRALLLHQDAHLAVLLAVILALEHVRALLLRQDAHLAVILVLERVLMTVNTDV